MSFFCTVAINSRKSSYSINHRLPEKNESMPLILLKQFDYVLVRIRTVYNDSLHVLLVRELQMWRDSAHLHTYRMILRNVEW